jgi:lactoylglutathione lyase
MQIEHIALWTLQLETLRHFYCTYFEGSANARYESRNTPGLMTYFIRFPGGARLELMTHPDLQVAAPGRAVGWAHIAFAVGSPAAVDALTERLRQAGYTLISAPRTTGDGYYESVILDPDGNHLEITV